MEDDTNPIPPEIVETIRTIVESVEPGTAIMLVIMFAVFGSLFLGMLGSMLGAVFYLIVEFLHAVWVGLQLLGVGIKWIYTKLHDRWIREANDFEYNEQTKTTTKAKVAPKPTFSDFDLDNDI